jgi:hypothetical protein
LGSIYKSTDGATKWTVISKLGTSSPATVGTQCIVYNSFLNENDEKINVFVTFSEATKIARSTDTGKTWATTLDITSETIDPGLLSKFAFLTIQGDYFFAGANYDSIRNDDGTTSAHPYGVVWASKDGETWSRSNVFKDIGWSIVNPDTFANERFFMLGIAYDDKTKRYAAFGSPVGTTSSLLLATSSSGVSFSGSTVIAQGVTGIGPGPDFPIFPVNDWLGGIPSGGLGYFVLPVAKRGYQTINQPGNSQAGVAISAGGSSWNIQLLTSIVDFNQAQAAASLYFKKGQAFLASISEKTPLAGGIWMSDDKAANWEIVDRDFFPRIYAIGKVGSWALPEHETA